MVARLLHTRRLQGGPSRPTPPCPSPSPLLTPLARSLSRPPSPAPLSPFHIYPAERGAAARLGAAGARRMSDSEERAADSQRGVDARLALPGAILSIITHIICNHTHARARAHTHTHIVFRQWLLPLSRSRPLFAHVPRRAAATASAATIAAAAEAALVPSLRCLCVCVCGCVCVCV